MNKTKLAEIRTAVADYMSSEGCSCCEDQEQHRAHAERLGVLLDVPKYADASGRNFAMFRSKQ